LAGELPKKLLDQELGRAELSKGRRTLGLARRETNEEKRMPTSIGRDEVACLGEHEHAQVIEVLPRGEYEWAHLDGATHLWLGAMDAEEVKLTLDPDRPVVVYCNDFQ
jgi:hypothetical protein